MTNFSSLLRVLADAHVEYVLVGGAAATVHGSARLTLDVDVVYRRTRDNLARLVASLAETQPYLRGAPPGLPFRWDLETLQRGLNFTLITTLGPIDLLGEVTGAGTYEQLLPDTLVVTAFSVECRCVTLDGLIHLKRAAGRIKDLEAIAELEALREERDQSGLTR
jgi:predicted nucleotidyltransferase